MAVTSPKYAQVRISEASSSASAAAWPITKSVLPSLIRSRTDMALVIAFCYQIGDSQQRPLIL
jgi:hypothetical protein